MITLADYFLVSASLFARGVYGLVTKKSAMRLISRWRCWSTPRT